MKTNQPAHSCSCTVLLVSMQAAHVGAASAGLANKLAGSSSNHVAVQPGASPLCDTELLAVTAEWSDWR